MTISIRKVSNGYLVHVVDNRYQHHSMQEFNNSEYVFITLDAALSFIEGKLS